MESRGGHNRYHECKYIPKSLPKDLTSEEALALPRGKGEEIFPLLERKIRDHRRMKLCSLATNELLRCRWKNFVSGAEGMKHSPFDFPSISEFHYSDYEVKYAPSQSPKNRTSLRMQMGAGPGVDVYGQLPIPSDMHIFKITNTKPVKSSKTNRH